MGAKGGIKKGIADTGREERKKGKVWKERMADQVDQWRAMEEWRCKSMDKRQRNKRRRRERKREQKEMETRNEKR